MGHARYACPPISSVLGGKREFVRRAREEKKYLDPLSLVWKFGLSVVAGSTTFHRRRERFAFRTFYSIGNVSLLGKTSLAAQLQLNPVLRNNYSEERDTLKYSFFLGRPFRVSRYRPVFPPHPMRNAKTIRRARNAMSNTFPPSPNSARSTSLHVGIYFALTNLSIEGRNVILAISLLVKTRGKLANAATIRGFTLVLA